MRFSWFNGLIFLLWSKLHIIASQRGCQLEDPLDAECPKTIFLWPNDRPLDPPSASLCDRRVQVVYENHNLTICKDTSCVECREKERQHYKIISKAFFDKQLSLKREKRVDKLIESSYDGYIIIVTVSPAELDSFFNLACSIKKYLGIDPTTILFVVALDRAVEAEIIARGYQTYKIDWLVYGKTYAKSRTYDFGLVEKRHSRTLANIQTHLVVELLERDVKVITLSANSVFRSGKVPVFPKVGQREYLYLFEYLDRCLTRRDLVSMSYSRKDSKKGFFHVGFAVYKPTFYSIRFAKTLENLLQIKLEDEQEFMNTVIRHYRMQQLTKRILSPDIFKYTTSTTKSSSQETPLTVLEVFSPEVKHLAPNCSNSTLKLQSH